jgi:hypothetical protein
MSQANQMPAPGERAPDFEGVLAAREVLTTERVAR